MNQLPAECGFQWLYVNDSELQGAKSSHLEVLGWVYVLTLMCICTSHIHHVWPDGSDRIGSDQLWAWGGWKPSRVGSGVSGGDFT